MASTLSRSQCVDIRSAPIFHGISSAILNDVKVPRNLKENLPKVSVSVVHADGLAPLGDGASAGTTMTKFRSRVLIYIRERPFKGWKFDKFR